MNLILGRFLLILWLGDFKHLSFIQHRTVEAKNAFLNVVGKDFLRSCGRHCVLYSFSLWRVEGIEARVVNGAIAGADMGGLGTKYLHGSVRVLGERVKNPTRSPGELHYARKRERRGMLAILICLTCLQPPFTLTFCNG